MYDYLLWDRLKKYAKCEKAFHMPGHKGGEDFKKLFPEAPLDITELSYSDNLACPDDVIYSAQKELAEITGAKSAHILTDGSTSGVLTMLGVAKNYGGKILVPVNSHQSAWNGLKLFGLEPVIVRGEYKDGVLMPPAPEQIEKLLSEHVDVCGMLAISPDYYGNIAPLKEYSYILKAYGKLLLVDGAHGAHLCFERENGAYSGVYADIWVDGAHKTLPTLTQGALLLVNNEELLPAVRENLALFRTSSPSYPVMASVEYGYKYLYNNPQIIKNAQKLIENFKKRLPFSVYPSGDYAKVAIDFGGASISAEIAAKELEERGIYCEMTDGRNLLLYLSPTVCEKSFDNFLNAVNGINWQKHTNTFVQRDRICAADGSGYLKAVNAPFELVSLDDAVGRICARNAGVTPPCIPAVVAGEKITEEIAAYLKGNRSVFGLYDGLIAVIK